MAKIKKNVLVSYGRLHNLALFKCKDITIGKTPVKVIVKTNRGLELGDVVGQFAANENGYTKLSEGKIQLYYQQSQINFHLCGRGLPARSVG